MPSSGIRSALPFLPEVPGGLGTLGAGSQDGVQEELVGPGGLCPKLGPEPDEDRLAPSGPGPDHRWASRQMLLGTHLPSAHEEARIGIVAHHVHPVRIVDLQAREFW
jgi:hypothetical protein